MNTLRFRTEDSALEYAEENIGKYDYEVVEVDGVKTILSATHLPGDELIRNDIESIAERLVRLAGKDPDDMDTLDEINFFGAEITSYILERLQELLGIEYLSAGMDY